ncbi:SDR family NAD(P)-dependent oxidoreductase [Arsenicicoccus sp. MKL-02]|uniref:SDR family NAD(P)-dependent oxidoreductase n=1 Tax=Arsenicicoccus cauae TaxID=2663847 RepID=A0A6I3ID79_9MICO|nr:SDR family NAD(P)-dependent oxidoreductase [Arsenicicoccus cauae]MTB71677.1 SDR family NAD(P)-dependent oxidoreductase [Arsenicicoccus cauae]
MKVLLTGATSGLGWNTAHVLASAGHDVTVLARNMDKADALKQSIAAASHPAGQVRAIQCDLADLASVAHAARTLAKEADTFDSIVMNAGLQVVRGIEHSVDGLELTMATNVLGHFLLYRQLRDKLPTGARVITLGSETHRGGPRAWGFPAAQWNDPALLFFPPSDASTSSQAGRVRYSTSKLCSIYMAYEIDRRDKSHGIRSFAFDPGLMPATGLARDYPPLVRSIYTGIAGAIAKFPEANTVEESSRNLSWLATDPAALQFGGTYVTRRSPRPSSPLSYDVANAQLLWDYCTQLTDPYMDPRL